MLISGSFKMNWRAPRIVLLWLAMDYNTAVEGYNGTIRRFPTTIWARLLGFAPREYFQAEESAHKAPEVKF